MPQEQVFFHEGLNYEVRSALQKSGFLATAENIVFEVDGKQSLRPSFNKVNTTAVGSILSGVVFRGNLLIAYAGTLAWNAGSGDFTTLYSSFTSGAHWTFREYKEFIHGVNGSESIFFDISGNLYPAQIANPLTAPTGADSGSGGYPSGVYKLYVSYFITWPNGLTYETGLSPESADVTVASKKIAWSNIPVCPYAAYSGTAPTIMLNGVSAGSLSVGVNDIIIASTLVASTCNIVLYLNAATNYSLTNVSITQLPGTLGLTSFFAETPTIYQPTDTNLSRCIKYNGGTLTSSLPLGIYYLCVTAGAYSYYSDYIAVVSMANPMLRFMKINFSNAKNLGNICYEDGFSQTVWFEAILNNPSHEIVNTGEEKDGIFIAEKITTKFIYSIIAYVTRSLYNCLVRLPQHSTITITDEVGNTYTPSVGNIIVSPGEWSYFDVCRLTINFNDGENSSFPWTN